MDWLRGEVVPSATQFAGHRELRGEQTICPGKNFPLKAMHQRYDVIRAGDQRANPAVSLSLELSKAFREHSRNCFFWVYLALLGVGVRFTLACRRMDGPEHQWSKPTFPCDTSPLSSSRNAGSLRRPRD